MCLGRNFLTIYTVKKASEAADPSFFETESSGNNQYAVSHC